WPAPALSSADCLNPTMMIEVKHSPAGQRAPNARAHREPPHRSHSVQADPQTGGDAVERNVRCLRCLLLSEETPSDHIVQRQVWSTEQMVGNPGDRKSVV